MTVYAVAEGSNIADISLVALSPQPNGGSGIIRYTRRTPSASGAIHKEGPFVPFTWQTLNFDKAAFIALLTQFGLDDADYRDVTIRCRSEVLGDVRMNGRAIRPMMGESMEWSQYRPRDVVILVINLETAS